MRQITFQAKMEVLDLYLQGLSADKVVEKTGVSKGAVVSIIKYAREGEYPQLELKGRIDELHSLAVRLRRESLDLAQARLGFSFLQRLLAMGIEPEGLEGWTKFCSEISPTPPDGFIPAAVELLRIERETGFSYTELVSQIKELADKRKQLSDAVGGLEAKEKRHSELEARLKELVNLDTEIADKRSERNRLQGEIEALNDRHQGLSSQMEKASADFERDIKLVRQIRQEVATIAEMKGRYAREVEDMEWAEQI